MKYILILTGIMMTTNINAQTLDIRKAADYEDKLDDVMELIDTDLVKLKLKEVETDFQLAPNELNNVRLALIYHETALNLTFFYKTKEYAGYAKKSYDLITAIINDEKTTPELLVFLSSYQGSALALMAGETRNFKLLSKAFDLFEQAIDNYANISPRPEFMRGSVAENLPWFMWKKRKFAKQDFQSIIEKQEQNEHYADYRLMSFSYWSWAKVNNSKKHIEQGLIYLDRAIALDPGYNAGRKRAEELKAELLK